MRITNPGSQEDVNIQKAASAKRIRETVSRSPSASASTGKIHQDIVEKRTRKRKVGNHVTGHLPEYASRIGNKDSSLSKSGSTITRQFMFEWPAISKSGRNSWELAIPHTFEHFSQNNHVLPPRLIVLYAATAIHAPVSLPGTPEPGRLLSDLYIRHIWRRGSLWTNTRAWKQWPVAAG